MMDDEQRLDADAALVRSRFQSVPELVVVLGSGLGTAADVIDAEVVIDDARWTPWDDDAGRIDPAVTRSVVGHAGQLRLGFFADRPVAMLCGRKHFYEGHSIRRIVHGVRLMAHLGVPRLLLTNAAGGLNPSLAVGDWMMIDSMIWWWGGLGGTPQRLMPGIMPERLMPGGVPERVTLPDDRPAVTGHRRGRLFDAEMSREIVAAAGRAGWTPARGCYLSTTGPTYETPAEYRMMRIIGADAVGMSTAAEAIAAARDGMDVVAMSMISNVADPDAPVGETTHDEVLRAGRRASDRLAGLLKAFIGALKT